MDIRARRAKPPETDTRLNRALRKKGSKEEEMNIKVEEVITRDVNPAPPTPIWRRR